MPPTTVEPWGFMDARPWFSITLVLAASSLPAVFPLNGSFLVEGVGWSFRGMARASEGQAVIGPPECYFPFGLPPGELGAATTSPIPRLSPTGRLDFDFRVQTSNPYHPPHHFDVNYLAPSQAVLLFRSDFTSFQLICEDETGHLTLPIPAGNVGDVFSLEFRVVEGPIRSGALTLFLDNVVVHASGDV